MAATIPNTPILPNPNNKQSVAALQKFDFDLVRSLHTELRQHAVRINDSVQIDGTNGMTAPMQLLVSTVAGLSAYPAATWPGSLIAVSNEAGGYTIAFSDGTDWRRVQDRTIVS